MAVSLDGTYQIQTESLTHQVHSVSADLLGEVGGEVHQAKELVEVSGVAVGVEEQTAVAARQQLKGRADVSH